MITANQHDKLISYSVSLLTPASIGLDKILIQPSNESNLYPNKPIKIKTDNNKILSGVLVYTETEKFIKLDVPLVAGNEYVNSAIYFETFEINNDNENITLTDAKIKLVATEDKYVNDIITEKGSIGLVTGSDKVKINSTKIQQTYPNNDISISTAVFTKIGNIHIPKFDLGKFKTFDYIFSISGKDFNCKVQINLTNFDNVYVNDNNQFELKVLEFSTTERYKNIELILNLSRKYTNNSLNYLTVSGKFDTTKIPTDISADLNLNNKIVHYVNKKSDIFFNDQTTSFILDYQFNKNILNASSYSKDFVIDRNVYKYNIYGVINLNSSDVTSSITKIAENTNLNSIQQPGKYYLHNGDFTSILNKPINNNQRFNLDVINLNIDNEANKKWLLQRYETYELIPETTNYQLITFERVSLDTTGFSWSPWIETGKKIHKHSASDINEIPTRKFVTETNITNWNNLYNQSLATTWKPKVATEVQLLVNYTSAQIGWTSYVEATNSLWCFNGTIWVNQTPIVSDTRNGIVSKEQFKEYFLSSGVSKKVPNKESFIHRLTSNPENIYGSSYNQLLDNHIDLVKRTLPVTQQLKDYVIQEGWDVNIYGNNSFVKGKNINSVYNYSNGTGVGLEFSNENQTIFGKYNLSDNTLNFVFGNGTSNLLRSNLFSVNNLGIFKAAGYSIPDGTVNDILVGNGYTVKRSELVEDIRSLNVQAGTEIIHVLGGTENYTYIWTEELTYKFGNFGTFEVWLKVAENIYTQENIPIRMVTEIYTDPLIIPNKPVFRAVSYTFTLSNLEAIILLK